MNVRTVERLTGGRVRARRTELGMKQKVLADACGISPSYLNLIEHDKRRIGGGLLLKLAAALEVEPRVLSGTVDRDITAAMQDAARAFPETNAATEEASLIVSRHPGWARLLVEQHRQIGQLNDVIDSLGDRMAHDPYLSASMHNVLTSVTAIRSTSAILAQSDDLEPEWQARFHRNVYEDSQRLAAATETLVTYLEDEEGALTADRLPQDALDSWLDRNEWHFPGLETDEETAENVVARDSWKSLTARTMALAFLDRYRTDAASLSYSVLKKALAQGASPYEISQEYGLSLPLVFRRLASILPTDSKSNAGFGLVGCDAAGALTFRKTIPGWVVPRYSAACPYWPLFESLQRPMQPLQSVVTVAGRDEARFSVTAFCEMFHPDGLSGVAVRQAWMLIEPFHGQGESGHRVGASCRICPEPHCSARREAPLF